MPPSAAPQPRPPDGRLPSAGGLGGSYGRPLAAGGTPHIVPASPPVGFDPLLAFDAEMQLPSADPASALPAPQSLRPVTVGLCVAIAAVITAALAYSMLGRQLTARHKASVRTAAAAAASAPGRIEVVSDPAGAQVTVDGEARGVTPLLLDKFTTGDHVVIIKRNEMTMTRTVRVVGGATASVVASLVPPAAAVGWLSLKAPVELQIFKDGRFVGRSGTERVVLPAGLHTLDLSNETLGFRTTVTVQVPPGKTASSAIAIPNGTVAINALPWADVWLDGQPVGTTPLANLSVPIGAHEILLKHPQLGERRQRVVVTARAPLRLGVDFNR